MCNYFFESLCLFRKTKTKTKNTKDFKGEDKKWAVNGESKRRGLTSIENPLAPLTAYIFSSLILPTSPKVGISMVKRG